MRGRDFPANSRLGQFSACSPSRQAGCYRVANMLMSARPHLRCSDGASRQSPARRAPSRRPHTDFLALSTRSGALTEGFPPRGGKKGEERNEWTSVCELLIYHSIGTVCLLRGKQSINDAVTSRCLVLNEMLMPERLHHSRNLTGGATVALAMRLAQDLAMPSD